MSVNVSTATGSSCGPSARWHPRFFCVVRACDSHAPRIMSKPTTAQQLGARELRAVAKASRTTDVVLSAAVVAPSGSASGSPKLSAAKAPGMVDRADELETSVEVSERVHGGGMVSHGFASHSPALEAHALELQMREMDKVLQLKILEMETLAKKQLELQLLRMEEEEACQRYLRQAEWERHAESTCGTFF